MGVGDFAVEASARVEFISPSHPELRGELIQDWIWPGAEQREITITFHSGTMVSFCFAKGSLTTTTEGNSVVEQIIHKDVTDAHLTPMALEYINVVDFAVDGFGKEELIDDLGEGPFEFVMKCYKMHQEQNK
eukprot:TRINITY_DN4283_c0_g1_i1.p1 TRINITY_DN4283_c0_g1~~TRINITY_DN4283_c0_g1_i1.p1  ORF type:complete len:132 (-),score=14.70 TRINITY_DN4283_c0_g1_i1:10-405(-)